jgi:phospholipid/cholesterol/gamma-HCH transport system ATP-binding protein
MVANGPTSVPDGAEIEISCRGLYKAFGPKEVLKNCSLDIRKGETIVILGQSGIGKSVLLKHINGLIEPDAGELFFDGRDITKLTERELTPVRMKIGMLFQGGALFDSLTIAANVGFALEQHRMCGKKEQAERVAELLEAVGLPGTEKLMPSELSGGMRKRASLARSLAINPQVLLYDEPTTGLDPVTGHQINQLIRDMQSRFGLTSVVVTHDIASACHVADRMAFLYNGAIAQTGSAVELAQSSNPVVAEFLRLGRVDIT